MTDSDVWPERARGVLRSELKRKGVSYATLAAKLTDDGTPISTNALANKVSRGGFSAAFLLQSLALLGVRTIRLDDD